jgi:hypothetical protein
MFCFCVFVLLLKFRCLCLFDCFVRTATVECFAWHSCSGFHVVVKNREAESKEEQKKSVEPC